MMLMLPSRALDLFAVV